MSEKIKLSREEKKAAEAEKKVQDGIGYYISRWQSSEFARGNTGDANADAMIESYKKGIEAFAQEKGLDPIRVAQEMKKAGEFLGFQGAIEEADRELKKEEDRKARVRDIRRKAEQLEIQYLNLATKTKDSHEQLHRIKETAEQLVSSSEDITDAERISILKPFDAHVVSLEDSLAGKKETAIEEPQVRAEQVQASSVLKPESISKEKPVPVSEQKSDKRSLRETAKAQKALESTKAEIKRLNDTHAQVLASIERMRGVPGMEHAIDGLERSLSALESKSQELGESLRVQEGSVQAATETAPAKPASKTIELPKPKKSFWQKLGFGESEAKRASRELKEQKESAANTKAQIEYLGELHARAVAGAEHMRATTGMTSYDIQLMENNARSFEQQAREIGKKAGLREDQIERLFSEPSPAVEHPGNKISFMEKTKSWARKAAAALFFGTAGLSGMSGTPSAKNTAPTKNNSKIEEAVSTPARAAVGGSAEENVFTETHAKVQDAAKAEKALHTKESQIVTPSADDNYGYTEGTEEYKRLQDSTTLNSYTYHEEELPVGDVPKIIQPGMDTTGMYTFPEQYMGQLNPNTTLEKGIRIPRELLKSMDTSYYRNSDMEGQIEYLWRATHLEGTGAWVMLNKQTGEFDMMDANNMPVISTTSLTSRLHKDAIDTVKENSAPYFNTPAGIFSFQNVTSIPGFENSIVAGHTEYKTLYHVNIPTSNGKDLGIFIHELLAQNMAGQEKDLKSGDRHETHGCVRLRQADIARFVKMFNDGKKHVISIKHEEKVPGMVVWTNPETGERMVTTPEEATAFKQKILSDYIRDTEVRYTKVGTEEYSTNGVNPKNGELIRAHKVTYTTQLVTVNKSTERVLEHQAPVRLTAKPKG